MLLKNLIKNSPKSLQKLKIKGLALNSKDVKKGFIFFAVKGNKFNGENYIHQAIKNGAIIIICSKSCKFQSTKTYIIKTKNMFEFTKKILTKVSFDSNLFKKELYKSKNWLTKKELILLKVWALTTYSQYKNI